MAKSGALLRLLTVVGIIAGITITAAILDRLYGRWLMPETRDIVFPAYSTFRHHSSEFDLTVKVNNLGFRGPNTTLQNKGRRVAVMGDSFTFGWGVEDDETWVHLLGEAFPDVEFLNLGRGGTHPGDHVQLARRALPLLNPDVVIVAVLQGNDIGQLRRIIAYERGLLQPRFPVFSEEKKNVVNRLRERVFPNLSRRFPGAVTPTDVWQGEATAIIDSFSKEELKRYDNLNTSLKKDFEVGLVNPSTLLEAITDPNAPCRAVDMDDPLTHDAAIRLRDHLEELNELCAGHGAQLLVLGLPNRPYGCPDCVPTLQALGHGALPCDTADGDLPLRWAADRAGVEMLGFQSEFILSSNDFHPVDGHWNASGNRKFALLLQRALQEDPLWNSSPTSGNF
jgi:lysophospholipase L1-like esterase